MREFNFFEVQRLGDGQIQIARQKERTAYPEEGGQREPSNFVMGVTPMGIVFNGCYGTNPSVDEIEEFTALIAEMVDTFREGVKP